MEICIQAIDCDRLLWECQLWSVDKPLDKMVIGGNKKVWRLDGPDGLIALIMKKINRVWPDIGAITLASCRVKEDSGATHYLSETITTLLVKRQMEMLQAEEEEQMMQKMEGMSINRRAPKVVEEDEEDEELTKMMNEYLIV